MNYCVPVPQCDQTGVVVLWQMTQLGQMIKFYTDLLQKKITCMIVFVGDYNVYSFAWVQQLPVCSDSVKVIFPQ